jgi:hypothetical protein
MAFRLMIKCNGGRHVVDSLLAQGIVDCIAHSCFFGIDGREGGPAGICYIAIETHLGTVKVGAGSGENVVQDLCLCSSTMT